MQIRNKRSPNKGQIIIYQGQNGPVSLNIDVSSQTIWASQSQISDMFGINQSVVSRHINNIFTGDEVERKSNMQKIHIANSDKPVSLYSLDILLAVGYRANSSKAIEFRKWSTLTLKKYITEGYAVNNQLIKKNYTLFQSAIDDLRRILPDSTSIETVGVLEIIRMFSNTWFSLNAYDRKKLPQEGRTIKKIDLTARELFDDIKTLKKELTKNKTASDLFARERSEGQIENIVRNVFQSFDGKDLYPSVEEKAAQLPYFVVKNHPFIDGNKRSGAFSFLWFLKKAKILNTLRISPEVLTTLTILVAESRTRDKDRMVRIILLLLTTPQ